MSSMFKCKQPKNKGTQKHISNTTDELKKKINMFESPGGGKEKIIKFFSSNLFFCGA